MTLTHLSVVGDFSQDVEILDSIKFLQSSTGGCHSLPVPFTSHMSLLKLFSILKFNYKIVAIII